MYFLDRGTYLRRNLDKLDLPLEVKEYVKQAKKQAHQSEFSLLIILNALVWE